MDADEFFRRLRKVETTGCWEWTMSTTKGYGVTSVDGKRIRTHRYAYTVTKGPIPHGMLVCHSCDNRRCCNPDHLWLGDERSNWHDAMKKGRAFLVPCNVSGAAHPSAKLTEAQREQVRSMKASGVSLRGIARVFGVTDMTIRNIIDPSIAKKRWQIRKAGIAAGTMK